MNVEAAILARITKQAKIVLLGNVLPIWDDPLWLAEQLAMIDMISRGPAGDRLGAGHGARERGAQRAAAVTTGSASRRRTTSSSRRGPTPGPFRWEGKHYHYRYVNPGRAPTSSRTRRSGSRAS